MRAELDGRGCEFRAFALRAELGVGQVALVAIRIAEVHARCGRVVQFIAWHIVAQHVAAIVGEPQFPGFRMPVETDRISHAAGINLDSAAVRPHAGDVGVTAGIGIADIARCTDRYIQHAVGTECDKFPAVVCFRRKPVADDCRAWRSRQIGFDIVDAQDARNIGHVKCTAAERDADRHAETRRNGKCFGRPGVAEFDCIDLAGAHAVDKQRAPVSKCHGARARHIIGEQADLETRRQLYFIQREQLRGAGGGCGQGEAK